MVCLECEEVLTLHQIHTTMIPNTMKIRTASPELTGQHQRLPLGRTCVVEEFTVHAPVYMTVP